MNEDILDTGPVLGQRSLSAARYQGEDGNSRGRGDHRGRGGGHRGRGGGHRGRGDRSDGYNGRGGRWRSDCDQRSQSLVRNWRNDSGPEPSTSHNNNDGRHRPHADRHGSGPTNENNRFNQRRGRGAANWNLAHNVDKRRNENNHRKYIGFKILEEISQGDSQDALVRLMERKEAFLELVQSPIEKFDMFVLIIDSMAKVCQSSFNELKLTLVREICNSQFIASLKIYLMELPYTQSKTANDLYWKNPDKFWENLITFFESVVHTSPTLALNKCRSLMEATSIACIDGLKERHNYNLPELLVTKLKDIRETMNNFEKKKEVEKREHKGFGDEDDLPPENFRELEVTPTRADLMQKRPYLRANVVNGAYQNIEHYLDVQFRLLREDCFGPLRDGLSQYIQDPKKKKYDNIRVFHDVKFAKPFVSQTKIGSFVQIDTNINRNFKRINWRNNKRFIYGSLVLFTKDNCKSFLIGTIIEREVAYLMEGLIPVTLMGGQFNDQLYNDGKKFTMIESEVYFEPYFHVMRALQDPSFPEHLAMQQYIVHVNPEAKHPSYLTPDTQYVVQLIEKPVRPMVNPMKAERNVIEDSDESDDSESEILMSLLEKEVTTDAVKFNVLQDQTWPDKDTLKLNESQLDAYKLALTHEFAVIQGPPGTGKTFLGIKVAKTLYQNLKKSTAGCLMLVICYTNHALDQFLEALLKVTHSIVRIGGQSRNESMEPINLTHLRRNINVRSNNAHSVFIGQKLQLEQAILKFQNATIEHDVFLNGVMKMRMLHDIPEIELLNKFYDSSRGHDALYQWLFEFRRDYVGDVVDLLLQEDTTNAYAELEKETRKRTSVQLDDQENGEDKQNTYRNKIASFSLVEVNAKIRELIVKYNECPDLVSKQVFVSEIKYLDSLVQLFNDMSQYRSRRINVNITDRTNFFRFGLADRWTLYFTWIDELVAEKQLQLGVLQGQVEAATTAFEEARMLLDMQVLRQRKIVGMTTSGAARMRKLLQTLAPPIVIVEEAAEVLEQHIVTSLTKSCKHLILIGDHQQLRPSAAHMKLARHYKIEVSLFERMINNGMDSRRLSVQHRMRPEIAALVCPHIYPELQNHPTVYEYPDVKGMTKNLFFMTHDHKEDVVVDNQSRTNYKEADLVLALANYLMQQGYSEEDVTILAAYKGQMFYMRKESDKYTHLRGVKITVVDNYQGEESKIILLSLVRNNDENKIGFLGTANRVCVALSRAKEGFYIFGNIENLKANSDLWKNIAATLEQGESLGTSITLQCPNHLNNLTTITAVEDFEQVPEGGCKSACEFVLRKCGHRCLLLCHGYDTTHSTPFTRCPRKCERKCEVGHLCPKKCADDCGPCTHKVPKTLPCGHQQDVYCHLEPDDESIKCHTMVEATLPGCGHKAQKLCFVNIKTVLCTVPCEYRIEKCGHLCQRKCHVNNDPEHEKYLCKKNCARALAGCTADLEGDRGEHQCWKQCWESCDDCTVKVKKQRSTCTHKEIVPCNKNIDEVPCMKNCARKLPCEHFCKKKCSQQCGDCMEMVTKEIPECKHPVKIMCKVAPTRPLCKKRCERIMSCGHKCKGICGDPCDVQGCTEPSAVTAQASCGHRVPVPCNMTALPTESIGERLAELCAAACNSDLACSHVCGGSCSRCHRGRLHAPCTQPCSQTNICQHQCEEPCNQICPPCGKRCEVRCKHSRCGKLCGAPCTPCKERCERSCAHLGACTRRCGEACSRPPCDERCDRALPCGHACRGLCAEPCPRVCNVCEPDDFPRDFLGDEYDNDAKFILLQDCGHVMEVEAMDSLMLGDEYTIEIKKCPYCRKPVINTGRYKDFVNRTFKQDINPIKTKLFGTAKQVAQKKATLQQNIQQFREKYAKVLIADATMKSVYLSLQFAVKAPRKVSKLQLDMESTCLDILDLMAECYQEYLKANLTKRREELSQQTALMCSALETPGRGRGVKVSEQQQRDLQQELRRLHALVQLARLEGHGAFEAARAEAGPRAAHDAAVRCVLAAARFDEPSTRAALLLLQDAIRLSGVVAAQERSMVVRAMNMKAGAWYKCPNGHPYCIGECGGAMQESKCLECGATIGGRNHALAAGNSHAGEIDGSRFALWSEEYNNMANFDL